MSELVLCGWGERVKCETHEFRVQGMVWVVVTRAWGAPPRAVMGGGCILMEGRRHRGQIDIQFSSGVAGEVELRRRVRRLA
jgi:hypothetical protein